MSSPTVGSSSSRSFGSWISARANSIRRRWPPGQLARAVLAPVDEADALKLGGDARRGDRPGDTVQGGVVIHVLFDRQVEVEGRLLEHRADPGQCLQIAPAQIVAIDRDRAVAAVIKAGDEREQRGLTRAVQAQQNGEIASTDGEADAVQRLTLTEAVADIADGERRIVAHGADTTPQGERPTGTDLIGFWSATSMIVMSFETPLAV